MWVWRKRVVGVVARAPTGPSFAFDNVECRLSSPFRRRFSFARPSERHRRPQNTHMFPTRKADPAEAKRTLRLHVLTLAAFCAACRAAPYVLHALASRRAAA